MGALRRLVAVVVPVDDSVADMPGLIGVGIRIEPSWISMSFFLFLCNSRCKLVLIGTLNYHYTVFPRAGISKWALRCPESGLYCTA